MKEKYLIVIDIQNDFVTDALGTKEAEAIIGAAEEKIRNFAGTVIFTKDTHEENYLDTQEGKNLPVKHCIRNTEGWQLVEALDKLQKEKGSAVYEKPTFGSVRLAEDLRSKYENQELESIELIGLCTDICVISNALLLKAYMPECPISVDASCCAGVSPEKHQAALETMQSCQIMIKNR